MYITKLDFTEIRENALGILRQNSFALIWHVCAAPHRFQILTMHRYLRIHSRYCLIDALLAMDICQHTHGPWTPCAFNLLMPPKHMSWDHMIKSCAQLHLSDPQGEFWWIWAYPNCKHPQCSGHSLALATKKSWLKAIRMVILQTEHGATKIDLGQLIPLIVEGFIHPLWCLVVFWLSAVMDPQGEKMVGAGHISW